MSATGSTATLADWRRAFSGDRRADSATRHGIDRCPWPGPRPLDKADRTLLIGRDTDRRNFLTEVNGHKLIVLSGPSGVGKSSLLEAGILPDLRESGFEIAVCNDYSGKSAGENPADFVARKVHAQFAHLGLPTGKTMFPALHDKVGRFGLLVLDQFEELIRYAPTQKDAIFEFLVALNQSFDTKVVISLRDEYLHELRDVESRIKSFSMSRYVLRDLEPSWAATIVAAPGAGVIDDSAVACVAQWWTRAQEHTSGEDIIDPYRRIGLLHLQAFLYAMHDHAVTAPVRDVDATAFLAAVTDPAVGAAIHRAVADGVDVASVVDAPALVTAFAGALKRSVTVKLDRCREAARAVGFDDYLTVGTTGLVARAVVHLSSGGYKLISEAEHLAQATLGDELASLRDGTLRDAEDEKLGDPSWADPAWREHPETPRLDDERLERMLRLLLNLIHPGGAHDRESGPDLVSVSRRELARLADADVDDGRPGWLERLTEGAPAWVADPNDVTCGPMSGMAPAAVLIEELRRFSLALAWMRESSLVRITTPATDETMISLVHDGFGEALKQWSQEWKSGPVDAMHALTAPRGASYPWALERQDVGGGGRTVLTNLRWRGGYVRSRFADVILVNCDFRGTLFDRCDFEGVTFVNCLLDGTIFSDCRFVGDYRPDTTSWSGDPTPPTFLVPHDDTVLDVLAAYRGMKGHEHALHSPLPGAPATPAGAGDKGSADLQLDTGGATVLGGRISSLVVRRCDFTRGGLSLRHTTGSGLELVEMAGGRLDLYGSSLRQITISATESGRTEPIEFTARGCFLGQVWVSSGLTGSINVTDCTLVQVWNESEADFRVSDSTVSGLLGVTTDDCHSLPDDGVRPVDFEEANILLSTTRRMDYRRNPAREEAISRRLADRR